MLEGNEPYADGDDAAFELFQLHLADFTHPEVSLQDQLHKMSVQLHPDIEQLDRSSLCYSIYSQFCHNFFNAQERKSAERSIDATIRDTVIIWDSMPILR